MNPFIMNPFNRCHGSDLRVACQIVHVHQDVDGTLVDLITLEPSDWEDERVAAGTPFTLGFTAANSHGRAELDDTMTHWEQTCVVIDLGIDEGPEGLRFEFSAGHRLLVVTVDEGSESGL